MTAFYPVDYLKVKHNYSGSSWQDFTGDLVGAQFTLREFAGTHTAALAFYRANMDPSQSSGTRVIKKGDLVRIHTANPSDVFRRVATFKVRRVEVAINLKAPAGRQNRVTVHLRGMGVAGVGGTGGSSGVGSIEELSNVVTGAPFQINGDDFVLPRTYAWTGTANGSTSTKTTPAGVERTNLCTNPSFETNTTGWSTGGTAPALASVTTHALTGTHCLRVTWPTASALASQAVYALTGLTVGTTYTFSGYVFVPTGSPDVVLQADGPILGTPTSVKNAFTRISVTFVATATSMSVRLLNNTAATSGQVGYLDDVLIETADDVDDYFDGDTTDATASGITAPTDGVVLRTNLCTNPSFETNAVGWSPVGSTGVSNFHDTSNPYIGTGHLHLTQSGSAATTGESFPLTGLTVGQVYTVSTYGYATGTVTFGIGVTGIGSNTAITPDGAYTRAAYTFTATATSHTVVFTFTASSATAFTADMDAVLIEAGGDGFLNDYFDGATDDTTSEIYAWTGGAHSSTSTVTGTFTEITSINDASELDQILLTRDSNPGTVAFEDPDGTVQFFDPDSYRTGASTHTITADDYSAIDQQFDMSHIINVLTIKYLEKIHSVGAGDSGSGDTTAQKATRIVVHDHVYTDADSLAKYGPHKKTHKVHKKIDFSAYADAVFAKNADPENVPHSVTIPILAATDLIPGYEDGHYVGNKVDVVLPDGSTTYTCRIGKIHHQISPGTWTVKVFLHDQSLIQPAVGTTWQPGAALRPEVANTPDGAVLSAHIEDDIDGTGKTITAATFQTSGDLGSGGSGMKMSDDTSGGVLKWYSGNNGETPGYINPNVNARAGILFRTGTDVVWALPAALQLLAGKSGGTDPLFDVLADMEVTGPATFDDSVTVGDGIALSGGMTFTGAISGNSAISTSGSGGMTASGSGGLNITAAGATLTIASPPTGGSANVNWNSSTGNLRQITSARRFKTDIEPYEVDVAQALKLGAHVYTRLRSRPSVSTSSSSSTNSGPPMPPSWPSSESSPSSSDGWPGTSSRSSKPSAPLSHSARLVSCSAAGARAM